MFGLFSRETVVPDQGKSLARKLREAEVEYGDEVEVELVGVGVKPHSETAKPMLCFCPAHARLLQVLRRGSHTQRRHDMPEQVTLTRAAGKTAWGRLSGQRGFAHLRTRILTNGSIHIAELQVTGFEPVPALEIPVTRSDSYELFTSTKS